MGGMEDTDTAELIAKLQAFGATAIPGMEKAQLKAQRAKEDEQLTYREIAGKARAAAFKEKFDFQKKINDREKQNQQGAPTPNMGLTTTPVDPRQAGANANRGVAEVGSGLAGARQRPGGAQGVQSGGPKPGQTQDYVQGPYAQESLPRTFFRTRMGGARPREAGHYKRDKDQFNQHAQAYADEIREAQRTGDNTSLVEMDRGIAARFGTNPRFATEMKILGTQLARADEIVYQRAVPGRVQEVMDLYNAPRDRARSYVVNGVDGHDQDIMSAFNRDFKTDQTRADAILAAKEVRAQEMHDKNLELKNAEIADIGYSAAAAKADAISVTERIGAGPDNGINAVNALKSLEAFISPEGFANQIRTDAGKAHWDSWQHHRVNKGRFPFAGTSKPLAIWQPRAFFDEENNLHDLDFVQMGEVERALNSGDRAAAEDAVSRGIIGDVKYDEQGFVSEYSWAHELENVDPEVFRMNRLSTLAYLETKKNGFKLGPEYFLARQRESEAAAPAPNGRFIQAEAGRATADDEPLYAGQETPQIPSAAGQSVAPQDAPAPGVAEPEQRPEPTPAAQIDVLAELRQSVIDGNPIDPELLASIQSIADSADPYAPQAPMTPERAGAAVRAGGAQSGGQFLRSGVQAQLGKAASLARGVGNVSKGVEAAGGAATDAARYAGNAVGGFYSGLAPEIADKVKAIGGAIASIEDSVQSRTGTPEELIAKVDRARGAIGAAAKVAAPSLSRAQDLSRRMAAAQDDANARDRAKVQWAKETFEEYTTPTPEQQAFMDRFWARHDEGVNIVKKRWAARFEKIEKAKDAELARMAKNRKGNAEWFRKHEREYAAKAKMASKLFMAEAKASMKKYTKRALGREQLSRRYVPQ